MFSKEKKNVVLAFIDSCTCPYFSLKSQSNIQILLFAFYLVVLYNLSIHYKFSDILAPTSNNPNANIVILFWHQVFKDDIKI